MKFRKEFEFVLSEEITYSDDKGNAIKTKKLFLKAPSNKQRKAALKLQQSFMQAIKSNINVNDNKNKDEQKTDKNINITGDDIIAALLMSSIDVNDLIDDLKNILVGGCCLIDGKTELNDLWFDSFNFDDTEKLLGEYIANFLLPSAMKSTMTK